MFTRILIDGAILSAIAGIFLVGMLYLNPRLGLEHYPPDVRAAVPPPTEKERQLGILVSLLLLLVMFALPLYSVWLVKQQSGGILSYGIAFATLFGEYLIFSLFDLLVLDLGLFCMWTPTFLVLPGTEGMRGYKDYRPHLQAHLTKGILKLTILSAGLALVATALY